MIFWMSVVLNRTVAVAFKYLKKAKHIMQPAKKMRTHEIVLPFQEKAFSADGGHVT